MLLIKLLASLITYMFSWLNVYMCVCELGQTRWDDLYIVTHIFIYLHI